MPELPDLQVFSRNLGNALVGKKLLAVKVYNKKKLNVPESKLKQALEDQTVAAIYREGKEIHVAFKNREVLGLHMMLRGHLHFFDEKNEQRFTIIEMHFKGGPGLAMTDYQGQATPTLNPKTKDSPDALSAEVNYTFLKNVLSERKAVVKNVLLDQDIIRGIGNAYADEILWEARLSPFSICNKIPDKQIRALDKAIKKVLKDAEKRILKSHPDIIGGEVRDFLKIHNPKRTHSPAGAAIVVKAGTRKTYYTEEQQLFS